MHFKKAEYIIIVIILLTAGFVRYYHIDYYSLWMDEVRQVSFELRAKSFTDIIKFSTHQSQPPLDYLVGFLLLKYISFSEFAARLPAFIFGTLTVLVGFILARMLFTPWSAVFSAVFLIFSPVLIIYSQEARPYSIFFFSLLLLLSFFFKFIKQNSGSMQHWLLFFFLAWLLLLTRGMAPVTALIALNIAYIIAFVLSYFENGRSVVYPFTAAVLRNLLLATTAAGLFFSPFFLYIWQNSHQYIDETLGTGGRSWSIGKPLYILIAEKMPDNLTGFLPVCIVGFVLGAYFIIKYRKKYPLPFIFLLYSLIEPIVTVYLFYLAVDTSVTGPKFSYFTQALFPYFIISSYGYYCIISFFIKIFSFSGKVVVPVIYSFFLAVLFFISVPQLSSAYYSRPKADYRSAIKYLRTAYQEDDVAIYDSFRRYGAWEPRLYGKGVYYGDELKIRQYKWKKWVSLLKEGFTTDGKVFLFLHAGKEHKPFFPDSKVLVERNFEQYTIIYINKDNLTLQEQTLLFIDELLTIFPDNSAKADLYLAKAELLCPHSSGQALEYGKKAAALLPGGKISFECN